LAVVGSLVIGGSKLGLRHGVHLQSQPQLGHDGVSSSL
jgi:hypothetical protein